MLLLIAEEQNASRSNQFKRQHTLEAFQSVRTQEAASLLYELVYDQSALAGRMGEQLKHNLGAIRDEIQHLSPTEAKHRLFEFVDGMGLQIWFAPHGKCLPLDPAKMRCHEIAGTTSWLNKEPNYSTREASVCLGCPSFVIDRKHLSYWKERYILNWLSWKQAERSNSISSFRVVKERAEQAGALLRKLGIETSELDIVVQKKLEAVDGKP